MKPYGSDSCHCRPDTTWERENKDFYSPECVNELHWAPILFVRICKAGKCISEKFAPRYYDSFGFGALMYIGDFMPCLASASCADHTSLLPAPLHSPESIENGHNAFEVFKDERSIFNLEAGTGLMMDIEKAICRASQLTSLRIGDFVAIELAGVSPLARRPDESVSLRAVYNGNELYDFRILF